MSYMSHKTIFGRALAVQNELLEMVESDEAAPDRVLAEQLLLLTLEHPTQAEIDQAFEAWSGGLGGMRSKLPSAFGGVLIAGTGKSPTFREATPAEASRVMAQSARIRGRWWDSISLQRSMVRARVLEITADSRDDRAAAIEKGRARLQAEIDAGVLRNEVLVITRPWWESAARRNEQLYQWSTLESGVVLSLARLLDPESGLAETLRVCRLADCRRIFLSQPPAGGGPPPLYCDPEHQKIATKLTGAERTRQWRRRAKARKPK